MKCKNKRIYINIGEFFLKIRKNKIKWTGEYAVDLINNNISRDVQEICIAAMMENSGYLIFEAPPPEKPWPNKYIMVQSFWFLITLQIPSKLCGPIYTWSLHTFSLIVYLSDLLKHFHLHLATKMCLRKMDIISVFNSCSTWLGSRQRKQQICAAFYLIYFSLAANFKIKDHNRQHNTL